jgi:hypothetical protein
MGLISSEAPESSIVSPGTTWLRWPPGPILRPPVANLDRSKPGERAKLLEELKTVLSAHLEARLTALG